MAASCEGRVGGSGALGATAMTCGSTAAGEFAATFDKGLIKPLGAAAITPRPEGRIGGKGSAAATRLANWAPLGRIGGTGNEATCKGMR